MHFIKKWCNRADGTGWVISVKCLGKLSTALLQGSAEASNTNSFPIGSRQRLENYFGIYPLSSSGK